MDIEWGTKVLVEFAGLSERAGCVLVGLKQDDYVILSAALSRHMRKKADRGNIVTGRYLNKGTVYGFKSRILDYLTFPAQTLFLAYPPDVEVLELRRETRIPCHVPAEVQLDVGAFRGLMTDLSSSGCRIFFKNGDICQVEAGTRVKLDFYAFEEKNAYSVFADVINVRRQGEGSFMGLRFDGVHKRFRHMIEQYVERVDRDM